MSVNERKRKRRALAVSRFGFLTNEQQRCEVPSKRNKQLVCWDVAGSAFTGAAGDEKFQQVRLRPDLSDLESH